MSVLQRCRELCLAQEPLAKRLVAGLLGRDQLDRHRPIQRHLAGAPHDAHPAPAHDRL